MPHYEVIYYLSRDEAMKVAFGFSVCLILQSIPSIIEFTHVPPNTMFNEESPSWMMIQVFCNIKNLII